MRLTNFGMKSPVAAQSIAPFINCSLASHWHWTSSGLRRRMRHIPDCTQPSTFSRNAPLQVNIQHDATCAPTIHTGANAA
jgi:hypothetical protein